MQEGAVLFAEMSETSLEKALELNNRHTIELSLLEIDQLKQLVAKATYARWCFGRAGFLLALDEGADYRNPNFEWFRSRYGRFVYVDRVVIDAAHRGRGLARGLYLDLFAHTARTGRSHVVCEVNVEPPNPASNAFHASLGFATVGSARLADRQKVVRYLSKELQV